VVYNAKKGCFGGARFLVKKSDDDDGQWMKLKLKPSSRGYAVKVLRKTPLCDELGQADVDMSKA